MPISSEHHTLSLGSFLLGFLMPLDKLPEPRFPPGFTKEDFEFSILYKCVQDEGCKAMRKLFRTIYSQPLMNTDDGEKTFGKYLKENCYKSKGYIKEKYKRHIRDGLLDSNLMNEDFDISFGYVIVEEICGFGEEKKFISKKLWEEAEWLKNYRNKIAHIYGYKNGDLSDDLDNLGEHLRNIYELLQNQKEFSISCTTEIESMENCIEKSKLFEIRQDDLESYIEDVKKFREDNRVSMTIYGRKEIYRKDSKGSHLLDVYMESLNPCTFLVNDGKNFNLGNNFVIPDILKAETCIELKDLFDSLDDKSKEVPKVIIMKGKNNSGKTSLCKFLLHSWATNNKSVIRQRDFDLAFYINVFTLKSNSLEDVFKNELLPKATTKFQDKDIIPTLQELDVLFLIDGLELCNSQTNYIIEEIFSKFGENNSKSRIFVTTTPDDTDAAVQLARDNHLPYLSLEIKGFEETQIREISQKMFRTFNFQSENIEENSHLFETHLKNLTIEPEHMKLPGYIILILILWIEDNETLASPQSLTSLYQNVFKLSQEKFKVYLKKYLGLDIDMKNVTKIFHAVGQSYLSSLKKDSYITSQDAILAIEAIYPNISSIKDNVQEIVFKLFDTDDGVRFLMNKTQMQYLTASFLFSQVNESDIEELLQCYDVHNFSNIIPFFVSIANINGQFDPPLASHTFTMIANQLYISGEEFEFWWFLVSECPNLDRYGYDADICSQVAEVLEKEWNLEKDSFIYAIKLLLFTPVKPKNIRVNTPSDINPFHIPGLIKAIGKPSFQLHDNGNSYVIEIEQIGENNTNIYSQVSNVLEKEWHLGEDNVVKAIKILQLKPESIKIDITLGTAPSTPGLIKLHEDLKHAFQCYGSKDRFKIEAHFYEQFEGNNLSYSDQFLLSIANLYPHAQLIKFTGNLGDDTKVYHQLGKCYKLESLNLRLTNEVSFQSLIRLCLFKLKKLKNIHICLDIPTTCDPDSLQQFPPRKGRLSLTFPNVISVDDMPWLESCVNKITNSKGCQELHGGAGFQIPIDLLQKMSIKEIP